MKTTMKYLHYSFDLWLTLIKSGKTFKKERVLYFFENHNPLQLEIELVTAIIREVDLTCSFTNELTGKNIDPQEMIAMILSHMSSLYANTNLKSVEQDIVTLFSENPPVLYSKDTVEVIKELHKSGSTISILSNTGFIRGIHMNTFIKSTELAEYIPMGLYSDEWDLSKPNPKFFKVVFDLVNRIKPIKVKKENILHIGDNPNADFQGANSYGFSSFLINSNDKTIKDLLK